jgi:ribosome biogenesis protein NSA2
MPQNDYMDLFKKRFGKRFDHEERERKKVARSVKDIAKKA